MKKIDSLRAAIAAAIPEIATEPARLIMWIDQGSATGTLTADESFEMRFRLNITIIEMTTDIALLMLAVQHWCRVNQPNLLVPKATAITFDADILDNMSADLTAQIDLTQSVNVVAAPDGSRTLEYLAEPDPLFDDLRGAGGADPVPPLTAVSLVGEGQIAPAPDA